MLLSGWYTEATPNNRMLLSLRSGIDSEIAWALERLCRLCDNEQFVLKAIPGLTDVLFEWPEWYAREGASQIAKTASLFSPHPDQERRRRHALECLFILRNAALNEPNAEELSNHPRTLPLIFQTLRNVQIDSDANSEFILHAIEFLQAVAFKVYVPYHTSQFYLEALSKIEQIAGHSSDRSLIIASLTALTLVYSNPPNITHMCADSPAFSASIRYLPLFIDKPLVDACLNYIYIHLSHSPMAKAFLLHPDMPSVLKLLVSFLLSEQLEESVSLDISGPVQTVPALVTTTRDHELTKDELDELLPKPEPQRCYDWCVQKPSKPFRFTAHSSVLQPG
jgi:chromatin structure-remodeling complex subunit RSC9